MTLLIAGYQYEKSSGFSWPTESKETTPPMMEVSGLFVASDGAITTPTQSGRKVLLSGFRKIYEVEAKLWKPYFMPDGAFRDYLEIYDRSQCLVGFAGSTLTAQHILNSISEHLGKLRISCLPDFQDNGITYQVIRHCQSSNPLYGPALTYWDDSCFLDKDFQGLLTGEVISDVVEYSINEALRSASSYKLDMDGFRAMHTDLICGVWCQSKKRHELYVFRMLSKRDDDGVLCAYTEKRLLGEREIVALGLQSKFEVRAQQKFDQALSDSESPAEKIYEFIGDCIDEVHREGAKEIDRPIVLQTLKQSKIRFVK